MRDFSLNQPIKTIIPTLLLIGLLLLAFMVIREFLLTLIWALIISYLMWPIFIRLRLSFNSNNTHTALILTGFLTVILTVIAFWFASMLQNEVKITYQLLASNISQTDQHFADALGKIPLIGSQLQKSLQQQLEQGHLTEQMAGIIRQGLRQLAILVSDFGRNILKLGVVLLTVFFCFRDGEEILRQLQHGLLRFLGEHQHVYLAAAGSTLRSVVYGLSLAAMAQGICAGLGYAVAGLKAPILFGVITALLALIPMGATLVWLPIALLLIAIGQIWQGVGLLLWGMFVVSTIDNLIRPWVISSTSQIPFLVVLFGVFGGLTAFGAVGLFLGPVILAVLLSVWQVWLNQSSQTTPL